MNHLGSLFPFAIVILVVAFVVLLFISGSANIARYRVTPIMTANEQEFFNRLRQAFQGHVFPQVAMSALITPQRPQSDKRWIGDFRRISQKRVDYALFTPAMELVAIVELDDKTHNARADRQRDALLESAKVPVLRWVSSKKPTVAEIRARLLELQAPPQQIADAG